MLGWAGLDWALRFGGRDGPQAARVTGQCSTVMTHEDRRRMGWDGQRSGYPMDWLID